MYKIGLFGGAFDPPTLGHLAIAEELIENGHLDYVWFVPCYRSLHDKEMVKSYHRSKMLMQMISFAKNWRKLHVCNYEIHNKMSGKTYDFLRKFIPEYTSQECYKDFKFYFIMGMDNALNIKKFADWNKVINMIPIIVIPRMYHNVCVDIKKLWFSKKPHQLIYLTENDCSSTDVRRMLNKIKIQGLPDKFFSLCSIEVFRYIIWHRLYIKEY